MRKFITSALPYVNNQPHLGNIIGCVLSSDVYSRFCRKRGQRCMHVCGTDEYGTAIEMEAIAQGLTPAEICRENRKIHKRVYDWFDIYFDYFGHTSSDSHTELVQSMFARMYDNGYFREEEIEQLYCEACSLFLADRYVLGECRFCGDGNARGDQCDACGHTYRSLELVRPRCSLCSAEPVIRPTVHLFFDLAAFKPQLEALYRENGRFWSQNAQSIFAQWMDMDLHPRCMTRDLKFGWGVPVPLDWFRGKVFYVWFDAPLGYLTFLRDLVGDEFEEWCREAELVQFMGKDNVSFHTVVFPAMLFATGEQLPLVKRLSVTEYLQFEGKKFSKSRRHGIFGLDLVDGRLGSACVWRYYLLKIRPESRDANFSFLDFQQSVTADLINNLGNFVNRVLKYIQARLGSRVALLALGDRDNSLVAAINGVCKRYIESMDEIQLRDGLQAVLEISRMGNEYIQEGSQSRDRRNHCFGIGLSIVVLVGRLLHPFMPATSSRILEMCRLEESPIPDTMEIIDGHDIGNDIQPLFNHFTPEQIDEMKHFNQEAQQ